MKNLKIWFTGLVLLAWSGGAVAQNEVDALRYSYLSIGGTARIQGLAGAQTALGADAGSMSGNPAGLGFFRRSEFTISPGLNFNETESHLNGFTDTDKNNKFIIPQFGFVFTNRKPDEEISKWRSGAVGIGFTRLNNFNARTTYTSTVADNASFLQALQDKINNGQVSLQSLQNEYNANGSQFVSIPGLAYNNFLIDTISVNGQVQLYVPSRVGTIGQTETIVSNGAQNEWDLSYGGSFQDKLFIGGSIGLLTVRYEQTRSYSETAGAQEPYFSNLVLTDYFRTSGSGINIKIGVIYKPVDAFRIGATVVTPTFYSLTDNYYSVLQTTYKPGYFETFAPEGLFNYNLTTPFRANGGLAYFFEKFGFISADIEYVDYSDASLNSQDNIGSAFRTENNRIASDYDGVINVRIGAEARFDIFRIRGGFGHYGDPYRNSNFERSRKYYTGGIGIRENKYFVDAAYVHNIWDSLYSPYVLESNLQPVVSTKNRNASFTLTAGFNF